MIAWLEPGGTPDIAGRYGFFVSDGMQLCAYRNGAREAFRGSLSLHGSLQVKSNYVVTEPVPPRFGEPSPSDTR